MFLFTLCCSSSNPREAYPKKRVCKNHASFAAVAFLYANIASPMCMMIARMKITLDVVLNQLGMYFSKYDENATMKFNVNPKRIKIIKRSLTKRKSLLINLRAILMIGCCLCKS